MSHDHHPQPHSPETQIEPQENAAPSYAIPPHTAKQQQAAGLTPVQRWAIRASDSQFNAIAGAVGGFTSGVVTCPLDVIKTKLQAQRSLRIGEKSSRQLYNGLIGTAKVIWKEDGLRGMYRGLGPIILGYLPTWAVWFTVYNKCKVYLGQHHDNPHIVSFWSSIIAGGSSTIATNPIWVIKTRLMSQSSPNATRHHYHHDIPKSSNTPTARPTAQSTWHYRSTLDAARKMYSSEGLASFYSGLSPALLGLTHVAVQFPTYEFLKKTFTGQGMGESPAAGQDAHWSGILSASILSKILASTATYPHEVIRTRLQTQRRPVASGQANGASAPKPAEPKYRGIVHTFRIILHEEGWRAFYAGLGTNMMRAVPAATVTMLTYEYIMRQLTLTRQEAAALLEEQTSTP
ncbi:Putative Mitochondrial carrier protein [[Torrubiella] hemipterigena]|uniref:Putative Mitochondrial carrier protein n=1 Tax=[Torrubiella] hemipterigena TaxID=1531966 RepID=A0A0A1TA11_9HYPO|nr:Putative Mitochondrial carrier protein [[Torrubiella] hemipterigena]